MKHRAIGWTGIVVIAVVLAACAAPAPRDRVMTSGRDFDRTHVHDIKKGVHDRVQIRAWFGEPYNIAKMNVTGAKVPACKERWLYYYSVARTETRGGHTDTNVNGASLTIDFDSKGKVCTAVYNEGAPNKAGAGKKKL